MIVVTADHAHTAQITYEGANTAGRVTQLTTADGSTMAINFATSKTNEDADALGGQEVDRFNGNQLGAGLSAEIDEQREDEAGAGLFGQVRVDVSDNLRWYARALANRRESRNRAAPEPIDLGPGAGSVYTAEVVIPGSNPYNPFGFTLDSSNIQTIRRRPTEGGPRLFDQQVDTLYAGTGLEGTFGTDARWAWDVNLGWARNRAEQENRGSYNSLRIAQALDPAVCATVSGCVPLDIFGFDTITPEMLEWISPVFRDRSEQTLTQATANLTGDLFRRQIRDGADDHIRGRLRIPRTHQAEIAQFHPVMRGNEHVIRLNIAVDNAGFVRGLQCIRYRFEDIGRFLGG